MTTERWRQVEEIFQAVVELDGAERDAFMTEACGDDNELRREIESLLAYVAASAPSVRPFREAIEGAARSLTIERSEAEEPADLDEDAPVPATKTR